VAHAAGWAHAAGCTGTVGGAARQEHDGTARALQENVVHIVQLAELAAVPVSWTMTAKGFPPGAFGKRSAAAAISEDARTAR